MRARTLRSPLGSSARLPARHAYRAVASWRTRARSQVLALFISALGHDADHPGVNNAFLINSGAPLAICYNDKVRTRVRR
eukprot:3052565-Pleurochrysis_carterae.AAC.1